MIEYVYSDTLSRMTKDSILALRLERHFLSKPLEDQNAYIELFRRCQPVSTRYFTRPGAPPSLTPRTSFDDIEVTGTERSDRNIVKGRFLGGTIGYVLTDEFESYANAFLKPLTSITDTQQQILDALRSCGPLPPKAIKDETGILNKHIMPALHRLQTAFVVYEDQADDDWERPWCLFEEEWPDIEIDPVRAIDAIDTIFHRFISLNAFATLAEVRDWSRLPVRTIGKSLERLMEAKRISSMEIEGLGSGFMVAGDTAPGIPPRKYPVRMLHRADPLTRAHATELKQRFGGYEILQYLLIDGEFSGAVVGHWRIGPHDVDDIRLEITDTVRNTRKDEIIAEVSRVYHPPGHNILKYDGEPI